MIGYAALGETRRFLFATQNISGVAANADSTPTISVFKQGSSIAGGSPVVTNQATGLYEVAIVISAANGFEVGKEFSVSAAATVGGTAGKVPVCSFVVDPTVPRGAASGSPTTTVIPTNITVGTADFYKNALLHIETGTGAGQVAKIGAMTTGGQITLATGFAFAVAPVAGDLVRIINR